VFPVRYGLNFYILFRRNLVFKGLKCMHFSFSRATYLAHVILGLMAVTIFNDFYIFVIKRQISG
jgi:hypothetical protein